MRRWFTAKEGAPLRKFQFMQSPEIEWPQEWVISSRGSDVTSKTDRCSLSARAPPHARVRAPKLLKPPGRGTSQAAIRPVQKPRCSSLLVRGFFQPLLPLASWAAPAAGEGREWRGSDARGDQLHLPLLDYYVIQLLIKEFDKVTVANTVITASFKELFISTSKAATAHLHLKGK